MLTAFTLGVLALSNRGVPPLVCTPRGGFGLHRTVSHPLALADGPKPQTLVERSDVSDKEPVHVEVKPTAGKLGAPAASQAPEEHWSLGDAAASAALFVVLHLTVWSSLQVAGFDVGNSDDRSIFALARLVVLAGFVVVQRFAPGGLKDEEWLSQTSPKDDASWLAQPYAPFLCASIFTAFSLLPVGIATASGESGLAAMILPEAQPIQPGRALDLLLGAPLQEEFFFRAWLLAALTRLGASEWLRLGVSAVAFSAWHMSPGDGGGLLQLAILGGWLGWLYERSGRSIALVMGTHSIYNGGILLLGLLQEMKLIDL